mgnify:CR=1 FL=1
MTRPDPDVRRLASAPGRSAAEIEAKLDLRARLAVEHLARLAAEGPERDCCLCGYRGRFSPVRAKPGIWCPSCDSRPRHRLFKLWLDRGGAAEIEGRRVLHFASEPVLTAVVQPLAGAYATADILPGHDLHLDMEAIDQPDGSWDVAIANHVLEHLDDRRALAELHRVLAPGGLFLVTVPLVEGWAETLETPAWTSEEDRRAYYTDPLHLRFYGRDFRDRLAQAGFAVEDFTAVEPDVFRFGLQRGETLFVARKTTRPEG